MKVTKFICKLCQHSLNYMFFIFASRLRFNRFIIETPAKVDTQNTAPNEPVFHHVLYMKLISEREEEAQEI